MKVNTLAALVAGILQMGCAGAAVTEVQKQNFHSGYVKKVVEHVREKGRDFHYAPGKIARVHEFSVGEADYMVCLTQESGDLQVSRRDFKRLATDDFVDLEGDGLCDLGVMEVDAFFRDARAIEAIAKDSCVAIEPAKEEDMRRVQKEYESVIETVFRKYNGE